jgi:ubiquinone/menaquinone biosynthesis C-methylase UbiE
MKTMKTNQERYRYALGIKWLAPLYDPFVKMAFSEEKFREHIIQSADILPNHRVIDLGCGTASLIIKIKQKYPEARVIGLDGDATILGIARKKIDSLKLDIALEEGMIFKLPYSDNSFDRVFTTLALHHLKKPERENAIEEMFRILAPKGEIFVADFGGTESKGNTLAGFLKNIHHGKTDASKKTMEDTLKEAGFNAIQNFGNFKTMFGNIYCLRAIKGQQQG